MTIEVARQVMTFESRTPPAMPPGPGGQPMPQLSEAMAMATVQQATVASTAGDKGIADVRLIVTRLTDDEGPTIYFGINVDDRATISWSVDEPVFQTWLDQMQAVIELAKL